MKQLCVLALLAALVSSCGAPFYTVATKDGKFTEYRVISVRDTSLVLLKQGDELTPEGIRAFGHIMPMDSIVGLRGHATSGTAVAMIGLGSLVGAFTGAAIAPEDPGILKFSGIAYASGGFFIGAMVGAIVAYIVRPAPPDMFLPADHRNELRKKSHYPNGEPDWLRQMQ